MRTTTIHAGDILTSENNGTFYEIIRQENRHLYKVRSWTQNEDGEPEDISTGYLTDREVARLLHEMTGKNTAIKWEA